MQSQVNCILGYSIQCSMLCCILHILTLRARFIEQGKLALERNSRKAPMGGDNSVGKFPPVLRRAFLGVK